MKIKISNTTLNIILLALSAGIILTEHFNLPIKILLAGCCVLTAAEIIFTWRKNSESALKIILPIIFFAFGVLRFSAVDNLPANDISKFAGQEVQISGKISEEPQKKILPNEKKYSRFVVEVEKIKIRGENFQASGKIILTSYREADFLEPARIGDKISASGNLKLLTSYKNPGQIDSVTRLKSDGITARMSADKAGINFEQVEGNFWIKFLRFVAEVREHYKKSMESAMSSNDVAAIFAMLFGGYTGINSELVEEFQTTGIIHILSVSGSHMAILAAFTAYFCLALKFPRSLTMILGIFIIATYSFLSGLLPQVIRSAVMGSLVFVGTALKLDAVGERLLTLTALVMLTVKPLLIFDISFQLSFTASAGLIYFSEDIRLWLKKFPNFIKLPLSATLGTQLASLPVIIWYFNQISLSAVAANILVIPFLQIVIVGGLIGGIVAFILPFFGKIFFIVQALIFSIGTEINRLLANIPFSAVQVPTVGFVAGFLYYVGIIFRRAEILFFVVIILLVGNFKTSNEVEVNFIDVGQGDCAVVFTPNKKCLIFDTGGTRENIFDVGGRVVLPYLKYENIREVDTIFLTHVHEDHSAGAGTIIKKMPVREIITAGESKSEYATVFGISENFLNNLRVGKSGEIFNIDGVQVEVIFAPKVGTGNEISNVYKISYGDISFLITGDLIIENEEEILRENLNVKSTVLKVGHHGSATSSSEKFLRAVSPKCAVISVGYGNNFGHPRAEILERLEKIHAKIYRTDKNGLIKFTTDGKNLSVKTFE